MCTRINNRHIFNMTMKFWKKMNSYKIISIFNFHFKCVYNIKKVTVIKLSSKKKNMFCHFVFNCSFFVLFFQNVFFTKSPLFSVFFPGPSGLFSSKGNFSNEWIFLPIRVTGWHLIAHWLVLTMIFLDSCSHSLSSLLYSLA